MRRNSSQNERVWHHLDTGNVLRPTFWLKRLTIVGNFNLKNKITGTIVILLISIFLHGAALHFSKFGVECVKWSLKLRVALLTENKGTIKSWKGTEFFLRGAVIGSDRRAGREIINQLIWWGCVVRSRPSDWQRENLGYTLIRCQNVRVGTLCSVLGTPTWNYK